MNLEKTKPPSCRAGTRGEAPLDSYRGGQGPLTAAVHSVAFAKGLSLFMQTKKGGGLSLF